MSSDINDEINDEIVSFGIIENLETLEQTNIDLSIDDTISPIGLINELEIVEFFEPGDFEGIVLQQNEINLSVSKVLEKIIEINSIAIKQNETKISTSDVSLLNIKLGDADPAVDQPGFGTQFYILNQYPTQLEHNKINKNLITINKKENEDGFEIKFENVEDNVEKKKDIIWYGRLGTYPADIAVGANEILETRVLEFEQDFYETKYGNAYDKVYPVTLNTSGTLDFELENSFYEGQLRLATPVKAVNITKNSVALPLTKKDNDDEFTVDVNYFYGENIGGRNLFDISNGRSYIGGVSGGKKLPDNLNYKGLEFDRYDIPDKISPYIVTPEDELSIACLVQPAPYDPSKYLEEIDKDSEEYLNQPSIEQNLSKFKTILKGFGRIVFYGSYIGDAKPISPDTNQPLTSLAIHEDVKSDIAPYGGSYCLDQFQLEPKESFKNSYLDKIIEGNILFKFNSQEKILKLKSLETESENFEFRKKINSVVDFDFDFSNNQLTSTQSFQRFVKVFNSKETFFDSHVPNIQDIVDKLELVLTGDQTNELELNFTNSDSNLNYQKLSNLFPFNESLLIDKRSDNINDAVKGKNNEKFVINKFKFVDYFEKEIDNSKDLIKLFYGVGSKFTFPFTITNSNNIINDLRGYRYGLLNIFPIGRSAIFRYDKFGQFRDMLESSKDSIFYEEILTDEGRIKRALVSSPINIKFVDRETFNFIEDPTLTDLQNLSIVSASNLPFFDGKTEEMLD
jgi:hypothetical protein